MSPSLLAHLLRLQRQTRRHVSASNAERLAYSRSFTVRDYYRPAELVWHYAWCKP